MTVRTSLRPVRFSGWLGGMTSMGVAVALAAVRRCTGAGELEARAGIEPTYRIFSLGGSNSRNVRIPQNRHRIEGVVADSGTKG